MKNIFVHASRKSKILMLVSVCLLIILCGLLYLGNVGILNVGADTNRVIALSTNYVSYYQKEPVVIKLTNGTPKQQALNNYYFVIRDISGKEVYRSNVESFKLSPNQSKSWTWNQKNISMNFVSYGNYSVTYYAAGLYTKSITFNVNKKVGSDGNFMFTIGNETIRQFFTNPLTIRIAIEQYYGKNSKIPNGLVIDDRPGKSVYDKRYSWHMSESGTAMVDMATEICDAGPQYVENNLDNWLTQVRYFCPWSARVTDLK